MKTIYCKDIFSSDFSFHLADTIIDDDKKSYIHNHDFYEFFIVKEGSLYHHIGTKTIKVDAKTLCFIQPENAHCFSEGSEKTAAIFTNVAFPGEILEEVCSFLFNCVSLKDLPLTDMPIALSPVVYNALMDKIAHLQEITGNHPPVYRNALLKSTLADVLILFNQHTSSQIYQAPTWLTHLVMEMRKEQNYLLGLKRFIALSGKSQEHLTRYMKKYYDTTPTAFINMLKLQKASYLLCITNKNVTEIAYAVGFENLSQFNKLFKSNYQTTPTNYRRAKKMLTNP